MAKVTQAVILAAGESSRFWPLASDRHKSMYAILGKPILQYTVESLKKLGLRDLIIVVSPTDTSVRKHFANGKKFGVRIRYAAQKQPTGMAGAILAAKPILAQQFAVLNASSFSCDQALKPMLRKSGLVLAATATKTPQLYGIFTFSGSKVVGLTEKPKIPKSNQRIVGTYILTREFLPVLQKHRGHYAFEDALNAWLRTKPATVLRLKNYPELSLKYPWHLLAINQQFMQNLKRHRGKNVKVHLMFPDSLDFMYGEHQK